MELLLLEAVERVTEGEAVVDRETLEHEVEETETEVERLTVGDRERVGDREELGVKLAEAELLLLEAVERVTEAELVQDSEEL